ncbi:MAG: SMP-30/gluconolactonase/LRE family protein, partial [Bacteroidota bacterium]
GEREFYVSNDHYYAAEGIGRMLEEYLQRAISYVNYFDGRQFRKVADGIAYANGITVSPDGKQVYVAATTGRKLITYNRQDDGSLMFVSDQDLATGVDNIDITANGDLWIGCHPQLLKYSAHAVDHSNRSPSQILRVGKSGQVEEIFLNDGGDYSGSTVGAIYGNMILIGSVFEPSLLICVRK